MSSIFSFLLLFISFSGWGLLSLNKIKVHISFIPVFVFSSITTVVFCAGLINIMPLTVNLIYYAGLVLFAWYTLHYFQRKYSIKPLFHPGMIVLVLSTIGIILYLKGLILTHYDNFSHWGLIVREMTLMDGLPDSSTIITFQNYPPGSAVFLYYVMKVLGAHESYALMAQALLALSCVVPMFFFSKWRKPEVIALTIAAGFSLFLMHWSSLYNLLVDIVLGLVAFASIIAAYYYRDDWKKQLIVNTPILILLMLVKDSGKIFMAFNILLILIFLYYHSIHKKSVSKKTWKIIYHTLLWLIGLPIFLNYLWLKYTIKAYHVNYGANKFAVTPSKVTNNEKSSEFMENIGPKLWHASTNLESNHVSALLLLNLIAAVIILLLYVYQRKFSKVLIGTILVTNTCYAVYMVSLYFMYVYLMPEFEASRLAGFGRYQSTVIVYLTGILMTAIIHEWNEHFKPKSLTKIMTVLILGSLFIYPFSDNLKQLDDKPETSSTIRWDVKSKFGKIASTGIVDPKVMYYSPKSIDDRGYLKYIVSYEQLSTNYVISNGINTKEQKEKFLENLKQTEYLVVLDADQEFKEWFSRFSTVEKPEGVYKVQQKGEEWTFTPI